MPSCNSMFEVHSIFVLTKITYPRMSFQRHLISVLQNVFSLVKTISNKALKHSINVMQETQSAILSLNSRDLHIYAFFFCISYTKLLEFFFLMVCSCFVCFFFPWVCPFLQFFLSVFVLVLAS